MSLVSPPSFVDASHCVHPLPVQLVLSEERVMTGDCLLFSSTIQTPTHTLTSTCVAIPRFNRLGWSAQPREFELKHGDRWYLQIPIDGLNILDGREWVTKVWLERITRVPILDYDVSSDMLESRARVQLIGGQRYVELSVDRVSLADAGLYRLWIENNAGRDYIDLHLRVAGKHFVTLYSQSIILGFLLEHNVV